MRQFGLGPGFVTRMRRFITGLLPAEPGGCRIDAAVSELSIFFHRS
ncbi:hypothetical protein ACFQ09_05025 [Massilia norwichensis]|uniref:Transposase n=1 Tax=Massilia norwichensis TaxID=1442366 RepID=A0ABT2AEH5_9BURK|nr:hypothetical protein [Massilia norwichensis]MCS0592623.1 hypothetical protein [Massilia norwichensis]